MDMTGWVGDGQYDEDDYVKTSARAIGVTEVLPDEDVKEEPPPGKTQHGERALMSYSNSEIRDERTCVSVQSDLDITVRPEHINSVSRQLRLKSACANAHVDLGLRCPQVG